MLKGTITERDEVREETFISANFIESVVRC